jgi:hypothetical protein
VNVNIVCRDIGEDKILPRLAKALAHGTGWSLSAQPDKHADLNYFIVYIDYAERFTDWHHTPLAAYFSHYEPDQPYKRLWWNTAAQAIDVCTITSSIAETFIPPGKPIVKVAPPIDGRFKPQERKANSKPRIGFSGFVDRNSDRKGSGLVAQLMHDLNGPYEFVASGAGWPCKTKLYQFSELPAFYNSLDVFVCTSSIEGIPMPPLEALACGVPVVIPHRVGLLDELEAMPGLYRYPAGNYLLLKDAIEQALNTPYDSGALAESVSCFNQSQWCFDHEQGFMEVKHAQPVAAPIVIESDRHGQRGVLYVAYGTPARQCAQGAIASFRRHMPNIPIALVSDSPLGCEDVFIQHDDEDIGGRSAKTLIDKLAPKEWQYILYLDADTEVIAPIDYLYQTVEDGFDFVICKNPGKYHTARQMIRSDNRDECDFTFASIGTDELIQLNGGVFCYQRNDRTKAFFETWHKEWQRWGKRDQAALLRSLFAHPMHLMVLGSEWNTITRYDAKERSAGILHYPMTARRWRGLLHGRSDEPAAWQAVRQFEATL